MKIYLTDTHTNKHYSLNINPSRQCVVLIKAVMIKLGKDVVLTTTNNLVISENDLIEDYAVSLDDNPPKKMKLLIKRADDFNKWKMYINSTNEDKSESEHEDDLHDDTKVVNDYDGTWYPEIVSEEDDYFDENSSESESESESENEIQANSDTVNTIEKNTSNRFLIGIILAAIFIYLSRF